MSRLYAYKLARKLNEELEKDFITISGKVERGCFESLFFPSASMGDGSHIR